MKYQNNNNGNNDDNYNKNINSDNNNDDINHNDNHDENGSIGRKIRQKRKKKKSIVLFSNTYAICNLITINFPLGLESCCCCCSESVGHRCRYVAHLLISIDTFQFDRGE